MKEQPPEHRARRERLHQEYASTVQMLDASQLAFIGEHREWTLDEVREVWAAGPIPGSRPAINHVYVHVPFCKSLCHFCNYQRLRVSRPETMRAWLDGVRATLEVLAPGLSHHEFHTLFIGGGTPSVLPGAMLEQLLDALDGAIGFHPLASRQLELDPATISRDKLRLLVQRGFQSFSMGIETLDAEVNRAHGRGPQGAELVAQRFDDFAAEGVEKVSCDFLLGLAGTTPERILEEIEFVLARHRPHGIDVYLLIPTPQYLARHFGGSEERFRTHLDGFQAAAPDALARLARRLGYRLRGGPHHGYALRRKLRAADLLRWDRLVRGWSPFSYAQLCAEQRKPLSLLGLGPSARSLLFGRAQLEYREPAGEETRFTGRELDLRGEARSFLVYRLRDGDRVDRAEFRALFGADVAEVFAGAVAAWSALGLASLSPRELELRADDRLGRMATLLWLVPEADIQYEITRHQGARV